MGSRVVSFFRFFSQACHDFGTLIVLPLMALIITLDVGFRYFFNAPFDWGVEVDGLLLFLVLQLSMTYAWDKGKHIRMELVYVRLGPRWRAVADITTGLTGIVFFGLLGIQSIRDMGYMIKTHESTEVLRIPLWPFRVLLAVISFVFVMKLVHYLLVGRKEAEVAGIEREGILIEKEGR